MGGLRRSSEGGGAGGEQRDGQYPRTHGCATDVSVDQVGKKLTTCLDVDGRWRHLAMLVAPEDKCRHGAAPLRRHAAPVRR